MRRWVPLFLEQVSQDKHQLPYDLDPEEKKQVRNALVDFRDIFFCNGEIGDCQLVEHDIDTRDCLPIKQPPRRLDFH